MAIEIPTFVDVPTYSLSVTLDETVYALRLMWSERASCWLLDVRSEDGTALALARPMVGGTVLNLGLGVPDGALVVVGDRDPQRYDLGTRCKLVYFTAAELEELLA